MTIASIDWGIDTIAIRDLNDRQSFDAATRQLNGAIPNRQIVNESSIVSRPIVNGRATSIPLSYFQRSRIVSR
jgi:hypothetical protein